MFRRSRTPIKRCSRSDPKAITFSLAVDVTCHDAAAAATLLTSFQNTTDTLRKWIAREHSKRIQRT